VISLKPLLTLRLQDFGSTACTSNKVHATALPIVAVRNPTGLNMLFLPAQSCNAILAASQDYFVKNFTISVWLMMLISKHVNGCLCADS